MSSHVNIEAPGGGSPFFPSPTPAPTSTESRYTPGPDLKSRVAAVQGLSRSDLQVAPRNQIQTLVESLLSALKNVTATQLQLGEREGDGSLAITSHIAVWLIGKVTEAYGGRLVRLSEVSDIQSLRSTAGLAELLSGSITKRLGAGST